MTLTQSLQSAPSQKKTAKNKTIPQDIASKMLKTPEELQKALDHLRKDVVLRAVIEEHTCPDSERGEDLFKEITTSIIGQQLSVKAADTITQRFVTLYNGFPSAEEILNTDDETLKSTGVSRAKVKYIKGLSEAVLRKELDLEKIKKLPDEEFINELTKIKGIGRWTAEMILIFALKRPDVFSMGDLGLRTAVSRLYLVERNDIAKIEKITLKWRPYRSLASRYLWKSLNNK